MALPSDEHVLAALSASQGERRNGPCAYSWRVAHTFPGEVDLTVAAEGREAGLTVALPSSGRPTPWVFDRRGSDAEQWVWDLVHWLDEEMFTVGLGPAVQRTDDGGFDRLEVAGYGFRRSDPREHARLLKSSGAHGWGLG